MPNNDGTGPNGKGPKTGRGIGKCDSKDSEKKEVEETEQFSGKGRGMGQGRGRCCRTNK